MISYEISRLAGESWKSGESKKSSAEFSDAMIVDQSPYKHSIH